MAEKKITVKDNFVAIQNYLVEQGKTEWAEFISGRIEILDKKSATKSKKVAENQAANEVIKETIVDALTTAGKALKIEELKTYNELGQYSTPKLSALLKQLKDEGKVVRTLDKKTPLFAVV